MVTSRSVKLKLKMGTMKKREEEEECHDIVDWLFVGHVDALNWKLLLSKWHHDYRHHHHGHRHVRTAHINFILILNDNSKYHVKWKYNLRLCIAASPHEAHISSPLLCVSICSFYLINESTIKKTVEWWLLIAKRTHTHHNLYLFRVAYFQ